MILEKIIKNLKLTNILLELFIKINVYSRKKINRLVTINNNGIHPKHTIMDYHKFFVNNVSKNDIILDIGCGNGFLSYDIAKKAKKVIGIDINKKSLEFAKKYYQRENLGFIVGNATVFNYSKLNIKKFDKIILSNILEHIKNRIIFLKKLHAISNIILLRVPLLTRDWLSVYKKEQGYEYRLDSSHYIEYTLKGIKEELNKSSWKIKNFSVNYGEFWGVIVEK